MPKFQKFSSIVTSLIISTTFLTQLSANPTCRVFGLGGTQPEMVCILNEFIKKFINKQETHPITNAIIFEGPTGSGKTEITKLITQNTGAESKIVYMRLVVTKNKNMQEAAEEIRRIYQDADDYVTKENKPIIIIIEEMEIIDASNSEKMHDISKAIIGEINAQIEKNQKNKSVVTIIVTNESNRLDRGLTLRCQRVIWTFPHEADRTAIMWYYLNKYQHRLSDSYIKSVVKRSHEFVGRDFDMVFTQAYELSALHYRLEYISEECFEKAFINRRGQLDTFKKSFWQWLFGR